MFAINLDIGNIVLKYGWYINLGRKDDASGKGEKRREKDEPLGMCPLRTLSRDMSENVVSGIDDERRDVER